MRQFLRILSIFLFSCILPASWGGRAMAQTFSAAGGPIPDDGTTISFPLDVSGLPVAAIDTMSFGIESVCFNAIHTWNADLSMALRAPDGTMVPLLSGIGGDTDGFQNTCLSGNADVAIFSAAFPFTGLFRPSGDMGVLNNGQDPNGIWELVILDTYAFADVGELYDWSITFGNQPCVPFPFESSDLPIIRISTNGQAIPDEPKIDGLLTLIDNGPGQRNYLHQAGAAFEGPIGVELHGNSTQSFPKKSLKVETRKADGSDTSVSLLQLPPTSDFVLSANFSDKTLMRNALTYELARRTGQYAPRTRFCEVVVNNTYQGVYLLTEKIKRGAERVDIAKLTPADTAGTELTGGYIVSIDWNTSPGWTSLYSQPNSPAIFTYFQHEYPRWDAIHPLQSAYIHAFVDSFETALAGPDFQHPDAGWRRFGDEKSFIDFLILNEMGKNVDGYRLSTYFYKDCDDRDRRLHMGPAWDFDLAWYNADYCEAFLPSGWAYNINYVCQDAGMPFWWERLMADTSFAANLACRWQWLRQDTLHQSRIFAAVDSLAAVVEEAQQRNFSYWPTLGTYVWPNPGPLPDSYAGEVEKMKNWIGLRLDWMDFALNALVPGLDASFQSEALSALHWQFTAGNLPSGYSYAWDFDDGTVSQEPSPEHQFPGTGTYTVRLTISTPFGCSAVSDQIIHIVNTGTQEFGRSDLRVWPNPAREQLNLTWDSQTAGPLDIQMINALGQVVLKTRLESSGPGLRLMLPEELPAGRFLLLARDEKEQWAVPVVLE